MLDLFIMITIRNLPIQAIVEIIWDATIQDDLQYKKIIYYFNQK